MAFEPLEPTSVKHAPEGTVHTRRVLVKKPEAPKPVKKYIWLAGHFLTVVCGSTYLAFNLLRWVLSSWRWTPWILYELAFVGVMMSYSISVVTTFGAIIPPYNTLLSTENFQTMVIAVIWIISRPSMFKIMPYFVVACLQLSSEYNIKPLLKLQSQLGEVVTFSELIVIGALLVDTFLFRGTSGFALALYLGFYWLRVNFSPYTQSTLLRFMRIVDDMYMKNNKSKVKLYWDKSRGFLEFRRSQTKRAYENDSEEEPPVVMKNNKKDSSKVLPKEQNKPPVGQVTLEKHEKVGQKVSGENDDTSKAQESIKNVSDGQYGETFNRSVHDNSKASDSADRAHEEGVQSGYQAQEGAK